jgi:hypothetical protein
MVGRASASGVSLRSRRPRRVSGFEQPRTEKLFLTVYDFVESFHLKPVLFEERFS